MASLSPYYEMSVQAQNPSAGRVGVVLDTLADASERAGDYTLVDVAVAYCSDEGARLLDDRIASPTWRAARKRFLVSFDFGFTQPKALTRLRELPNAEVRVPNGRATLASRELRPPSAFHAKVFAFRGLEDWFHLRALIVGSANLTASALSTGAEVVTTQLWTNPAPAWEQLRMARPVLDWFEDAWDAADPLAEVLEEYRSRRRAIPKPRPLREDKTPATRRYLADAETHVVTGSVSVQLAAARSLWFHASSMTNNFGPNRPGNQLNTPRGTRVFFGMSPRRVPNNTTLGSVRMRVSGRAYVERTIRFSDNSMDVINLPIAEHNGLDTYEGTYIVFARGPIADDGLAQFTVTVTDAAGIEHLKEAAANSVDLFMASGREYGLLF